MKKFIVLLLCCSLILPLSACGGSEEEPKEEEPATEESAPQEGAIVDEDAPAEDFTEMEIGGTLETDFADMTFDETAFEEDLRKVIPLEEVAENTKLEPIVGYQYIYLKGTITNKTEEDLPVTDFMAANFRFKRDNEDHNYGFSGDKCIVLNEDNTQTDVVPAGKTLTYTMYNSVPNEMIENAEHVIFYMGFFNDFNKEKLDQLIAYDDNPIIKCPYQVELVIK